MSSNEISLDFDMEEERPRSFSRRSSKKEALLKIIAQEMVTSLLGEDDEDDDDEDDEALLKHLQEKLAQKDKIRRARKKAKDSLKREASKKESSARKLAPPSPIPDPAKDISLSDLYYNEIHSPRQEEKEIHINGKGDDPFAGADLHGLVLESPLGNSKTGLRSQGSRGSRSSGVDQVSERRLQSKDKKAAAGESESCTKDSKNSKELSISEIRQYVLENIPPAIRDQIPEEAWSQIFAKDSRASKGSKGPSIKSTEEEEVSGPIDSLDVDADDMTLVSDISGLTGAFPDGKQLEYSRQTFDNMERVEEENSGADQYAAKEVATESTKPPSSRVSFNTKQHSQVSREESRRIVTFDQVQVRYYERIVTDNPAVQSGPALGIGWRYKRGGVVDLDYWEQGKSAPRKSTELVIPRTVREAMLKEAGVTQKEIAEMVRATLKVKNQRKQTVTNLATAGAEEAIENARRKVTRLLTFGRSRDILRK